MVPARDYSIRADDGPLIEHIRRCIYSDRNCILFAGAGLSAQAETARGEHPPPWKGLLGAMTEWCVQNKLVDQTDAEALATMLHSGYLLEAGQELDEILREKSQKQQCLREVLHSNDLIISKAHEYVAQTSFRAYLTTNYDALIETAYARTRSRSLITFYQNSVDSVLQPYRDGEDFILKLHGDVNDPASVILGDRSYEQLLRNPNYAFCLNTLFATASILFVGFGGSDPDLDGLLRNVAAFNGRRARHWMVVPSRQFPALKAKRLLRDRGVQVVGYEQDESHSGLVNFLASLIPSPTAPQRQIATLEPRQEVSLL